MNATMPYFKRKPRAQDSIDEFLANQEDEYIDYEQIRPRHDDSMDRMDEDECELLHVEEV